MRRINAGNGTGALKVNPFDDRLYLGKSFGGIVEVYDPFTMLVSEMLDVGGGISYQTIDGEENSLLMLQPRSRVIRSLNLVSRKSHILLDTGETPYWVAIYGER